MVVTYDLGSPGGVKHHALALAESLRKLGDEVSIIGPATTPLDEPHVTVFNGGVTNVQSNGGGNALGLFIKPWEVNRYFEANRFDVIHVHEPQMPSLPYWAIWLTARIPHVATFHAFMEQEAPALLWLRRMWAPLLFPFFQRGIAVSRPAQRLASKAWHRPLTVIPNGVSTRFFRPPGREPEVAGAPLRLLFVGRLVDHRKGFRYMLDAYARLRNRGLNVTLDVVGDRGDGPPPPALPGLTYHGVVSMDLLAQRYRSCDVFVAPATGQESFGMILLEAMASARPVVCSDIEGFRQVVDEQGARLVPPRDAAALEHAIAELAAEPALRRRMGAWNRRRAEAFDWDHVAEQVREEYLSAIAQRNGLPAREALVPVAAESEPKKEVRLIA